MKKDYLEFLSVQTDSLECSARGQPMSNRKTPAPPTDDLDEFITQAAAADGDFRQSYDDAATRSALLQHLVSLRRAQHLSQTDVSRSMGTTQSAISELEGGATDPHLSTLQRYARAVNASLRIAVAAAGARSTTRLISPWRTEGSDQYVAIASQVARGRPASASRFMLEGNVA